MHVIILAGGSGTRLWPISRDTYPKQFLKIGDHLSFLQKTLLRFEGHTIWIVTSKEYFHLVQSQALQLNLKNLPEILIEPCRKNTAPAIGFALHQLLKRGISEDEVVLISSSDAVFSPEERLTERVPLAEELAKKGEIVIFGVKPNKPETGYGYIHTESGDSYTRAKAFIEKPSLETASAYVASGAYLWNIGLYVFTIRKFFEELQKFDPQMYTSLEDNFSTLTPISIDHAITEKTDDLFVIPLQIEWSDVGSWDSIFDLLSKDSNRNAKIGQVVDIDTKNSLIIGGKRLVSVVGLEDMVVIETDDALFLGKKGESQKVKALVEELARQGKKEGTEHSTIYRPWGHYTILEEAESYKVKRIVVHPLQTLSLQMHYRRSEHWVVVRGVANITVGEQQSVIHENESTFVPKATLHRLANLGSSDLEIIEVQVGEYVGEDDIVRFEDVYGRV